MEKKKFKNIRDQFNDYQKQNAIHNLRTAVFNYLWVLGDAFYDTDEPTLTDLISGYVDEFFKESE